MGEVELYRFAKWVAKEACQDDFAENAEVFAEAACRKLYYLGLVEKDGAWWALREGGRVMDDNAKDYPPYLDYPKPRKPITNADRIRSMTDEELADLYMKAIEDEEYPGWWGNRMGLLAWLKQEAGE